MTSSTKLEKILIVLVPDAMNRIIDLHRLKARAQRLRNIYLENQYKTTYKDLEEYYATIYTFRDNKYWFMANLPSYGRHNTVL